MNEVENRADITSIHSAHMNLPRSLASGVVSGLFFISGFLALACLVPVQFAFAREGKKEGFHSLLTALLVIAAGNALRLANLGFLNASFLFQSMLMPALLFGALAAMHVLKGETWIKLTGAWILLSIAFGYLLQSSLGSASMQESISMLIAQLIANTGIQAPDTAILVRDYVAPAVALIMNCFGAVIWLVLAGSWWLGNRLALGQQERKSESGLHQIVVPSWLLWPSMFSWMLLLAVLYRRMHGLVAIAAWNASLAAAAWYGLQGIGIIVHFFKTRGMPRGAGLFLLFLAMLGLLDSKVGLAEMIVLPALGVTEVWSNYRTRKGA